MKIILTFFCIPFFLFGKEELWQETALPGFSAKATYASSLSIQDTLNLTLLLAYPADFSVNKDALREHLLQARRPLESPFRLIEEREEKTIDPKTQKIREVLHYILEPQKTGNLEISFFLIEWKNEKKSFKLFAPIFSIQVTPIPLMPTSDWLTSPLASLTPRIPIEVSDSNRRILLKDTGQNIQKLVAFHTFPWLAIWGFIFLGVALPLGYFYLKRRAPKEKQEQKRLNATEKALNEIKKLKKKEALSVDAMLHILRTYIQEAYQMHATSLTTEEFLFEMVSNPFLTREKRQKLANFLKESDQIRFGKQEESSQKEKMQALFLDVIH